VAAGTAGGHPVWVLGGIGVAAGFLSALFGVGGGIVVVPLLILLAGFGARRATGTSLAAIAITAALGAASFAALDEISWSHAAVVGFPAVGGAIAGTRLQREVSSQLLILSFALFLVAVAALLILE
jgi:uncharacterized protein